MATALRGAIARKRVKARAPLDSVATLCHALQSASVRYCHWKSNNTLDKSATGDKDLDLLVARADSLKFSSVLSKCGFKPAHAPADKRMPGVLDYFGYDAGADKWVHVHAHYQLVVGHDLSKNYRLAIEQPYLESAVQRGIFKVPAPEFEFIVFVIRMVLKHSIGYAIIAGEGRLKPAERNELLYLQNQVEQVRIDRILERHLPYLGVTLFWNCVDALASDSSTWCRVKVGHRLATRLRAHARRARHNEFALTLSRRRIRGAPHKYRLGTGGALIAIVGGDGAGKSTAVDGLHRWLSGHFTTTCVHLGKPAWSPVTITVRGFLKIGHLLGLYGAETSVEETLAEKSFLSPGYAWLIREVCRARDRYWTYIRARRRAENGGLVIFDRFPLAQIELMDGPLARRFVRDLADPPSARHFLQPRADNRLARFLIQLEENYYKEIVPPELLIVLRVDPDTAVQRKPDEQERHVRERSTEVWRLNWQHTRAHIIEASKCRRDVLAELKELIWAQL
jgi:thymidylate kinase